MEHVRALRRFACFVTAAAAIVAAITLASPAHARGHHHRHHHHHHAHSHHHAAGDVAPSFGGSDPRPAAWCGWWLRHYLGFADRTLNLAIAWARIGSPAPGPAPGVVAVWPHHVGVVTAVPGPGRIVLKSGNTGPKNARGVYEAERSTRGVVAWRYP